MADKAVCRYRCPNCENEIEQEGYVLVDASDTAEVETLLSGLLNTATCEKCGTLSRLAMPLVYHDFNHELLICFVPQASTMTPEEINQTMAYPYSLVITRVAEKLGIQLPAPETSTDENGQMVQLATLSAEEAARLLPGYLLRPTIVDGMEVVQAVVQAVQDGLSTQTVMEDMARLQLLNSLLNTADPITRRKILTHSHPLLNDEFFEVMDTLIEQMQTDNNEEMQSKLQKVRRDVENYRNSLSRRLNKTGVANGEPE